MIKKIMITILTFLGIFQFKLNAFSNDFVIITNKSNSVSKLTLSEVKGFFKMDIKNWGNGKRAIIVLPSNNSPESKIFNKNIYNMNDVSLKKFWFSKIFKGEVTSPPVTLNSSGEIIKYVEKNVGAISYINKSALTSSVKVINID